MAKNRKKGVTPKKPTRTSSKKRVVKKRKVARRKSKKMRRQAKKRNSTKTIQTNRLIRGYKRKGREDWEKAFREAKTNLGLTGFHRCSKGSKFYEEVMRLYYGSDHLQ